MAQLPVYTGIESQDLANIAWLQNPNFDMRETNQRAAAKALGSGVRGGGFAATYKPREQTLERTKRLGLAGEMLRPYQERDAARELEQQRQAAEDRRLALEQGSAMERLRAQQDFERQQQAAELQAAMERLRFSGSEDDRRLAEQLAAELRNVQLDIASREQITRQEIEAAARRQAEMDRQAMERARLQAQANLSNTLLQNAPPGADVSSALQTLIRNVPTGTSVSSALPPPVVNTPTVGLQPYTNLQPVPSFEERRAGYTNYFGFGSP